MRSALGLVMGVICVAALAGCSSDPMKEMNASNRYENYLPPDSRILTSGTGVLTCTTPEKGTLYLLDMTDMVRIKEMMTPKVIASGLLPQGTEITFEPQAKRIYAKGKEGVHLSSVDATHTHEIRFAPAKK